VVCFWEKHEGDSPKPFLFSQIIFFFVKKNAREDFFKHATCLLKDQVADRAPHLHFQKRPLVGNDTGLDFVLSVQEKFETEALFLRLRLASTLSRHENEAFRLFENAFQPGGM